MAYGIKYSVDFSLYTLEISQKDYVGSVTAIEAGNPAVLHRWDKDEPTPPIKGSSMIANIIGVPLLDFYANNDDEFKGELYKDAVLLFSGFLVQDDCIEDVDDLIHPVSLSFTDGLGLLKDVSMGDALTAIGETNSKITLLQIIRACLVATGLSLPLEIFAELKEDTQDTVSSFFDQTLIAKESFLKSEREYDNCYNVLESIMSRFNATLIQANGQWNIIRWHEHTPTSFQYDAFFALTGTGTYDDFKVFGRNEDIYPEAGYNKKILRPYNLVKETFNYELPPQILKNADLKDLGTLITTYSSGTDTVKEYEFPKWFDSTLAGATATYFIRVVTDVLGNETERYVVVKGDAIMSTDIEGDAGDVINFSFSIRTGVSVSLPANLVFVVRVTDGTSAKYADEDGITWKNTTGYAKTFSIDLTQWQNVEIKTGRLPFSGLVTVFLTLATPSSSDETHYNDLRFEYTAYINESTKITGQTHTNTQAIDNKNKNEADINIDDSPRNFIGGTLFLDTLTGLLQTRTSLWNTGKRLGEITTQEEKQWRSDARTITEGTLHGDVLVSPMSTFTSPIFPDLNFVPGLMEIDYANKTCSGTMWELYKTGESDVASEYKFEYIYDTK